MNQKKVCEDGMEEDAILCAHECTIHCNIVDDFLKYQVYLYRMHLHMYALERSW